MKERDKRHWLVYLGAVLLAVVIALISLSFEVEAYGMDPALLPKFVSNGFFLTAVLYLGCGVLVLISEAGNFYGIQFLGYTLVHMRFWRKGNSEEKKDYFTYCTEKKAKQKEKGNRVGIRALLYVGVICLVLSGISAYLFYR